MSPNCSFAFTAYRRQKAVYWGGPVSGGYGDTTFDEPVQLDVRWVQAQELFVDSAGKEVRSNAVVYLGQDVDLGGYLMFGTLDDLSSADVSPLTIRGAYEIRAFSKVPNYRASDFLRKAMI